MKATVFFLLLVLIGFSSCTSGLRIEKRQHRNGFYIAGISNQEHRTDDSVPRTAIRKDIPDAATAEEQQPLNNEAPAEAVGPALADTVTPSHQGAVPAEKIRSEEKTDPVASPEKKTPKRPYEGPADGRRLHDLFWTACIITAFGIAVMLVVFLVPLPYFFFILASLAWLAVLVAIVMNICVAAIAADRSRFYADKDKETSEFYRKLKRKALWYFAILGGAIVLSYIGIMVFVLFSMI